MFAENIADEYERNEYEKFDRIKEKGYDPQKIFEKSVSIEFIEELENELLDVNDLKSAYDSDTYTEKRSGPAPDSRWQFVAKDTYGSMSVNGRQKVIKSTTDNQNIYHTMTVALGHEWGHVFQNINKEEIPLRLFKKIGGDRANVFSEGGAMLLQDQIAHKIFDTRAIGHPHYIRAMIKKMEGGDYTECIKAFYESDMRVLYKQRSEGNVSDDEFEKESAEKLKLAINRAKRLFRPNLDFTSSSSLLTASKDTAYLEQIMLARKLQEKGLEKYAFFAGMNMSTIAALLELGVIDVHKVKMPSDHVYKIWDRIKDRYSLG